jgi:hypothetical protein
VSQTAGALYTDISRWRSAAGLTLQDLLLMVALVQCTSCKGQGKDCST